MATHDTYIETDLSRHGLNKSEIDGSRTVNPAVSSRGLAPSSEDLPIILRPANFTPERSRESIALSYCYRFPEKFRRFRVNVVLSNDFTMRNVRRDSGSPAEFHLETTVGNSIVERTVLHFRAAKEHRVKY